MDTEQNNMNTGGSEQQTGTQPPQSPYGSQQAYGGQQPYGSQPPFGGQRPPCPDSYLVWAILTTVLCFLPLGVVSIVYAVRVDSCYTMGDYAGALENSRKAKKWAIWSAAVSAAFLVVYAIVVLVCICMAAIPMTCFN